MYKIVILLLIAVALLSTSAAAVYQVYNDTVYKTSTLVISGEFKIESPAGEGIAGMMLNVLSALPESRYADVGVYAKTDENGKASLSFPAYHPFVVKGTKAPDYQDMYIFGRTGSTDFQYTSFMGTRTETQAMAALSADIPAYDANTGYVIVGMDFLQDPDNGLEPSNLVPAVGATARVAGLATPYGGFIFDPTISFSTTLTNRSSSFVTYPNVQVGVEGHAEAFNASDMSEGCLISPGFNQQVPPQYIEAFPDSVTVVCFLC
jgi:hypothetical protein